MFHYDPNTAATSVNGNGICIGCGVCAGLAPRDLVMKFDREAGYHVDYYEGGCRSGDALPKSVKECCPFTNSENNEDTLGARCFGAQDGIEFNDKIGFYLKCFAGFDNDEEKRLQSTSGGITTWLLQRLFDERAIDAAICVVPTGDGDTMFEYTLVDDKASMQTARKSRYYPIEMSNVLPEILSSNKRFAFVGIPCFVKAIRLAMMEYPALEERIRYCFSIFCGHMKTPQFADYLSRACNTHESLISSVDFRKKTTVPPAWNYAFEAESASESKEEKLSIIMKDVWGSNWSLSLFMKDACHWCDDVVGETADISFGDAWLYPYSDDPNGTNIVICRNAYLLELLESGYVNDEISLKDLSVEKVIESQAGSFRTRRNGLAYRLSIRDELGLPSLEKRVPPNARDISLFYRVVQILRIKLQQVSARVFADTRKKPGNWRFIVRMAPLVILHDVWYLPARGFRFLDKRLRRLRSK